jgi:DNA-binding ferritin-like protein
MVGNSTESVGNQSNDIDIDALAERLRELAPDQDALEEVRDAQERACVDLVLAADAVKSFLKFDAKHAEQIRGDLRRAVELAKAIAEETHAASASIARAKRVLIEANVIGEDELRAFDPDAKRNDY